MSAEEWAVPGVPRAAVPAPAAPASGPVLQLRQAVLGVLAAPAVGAPQDLTVLLTVVEQLRGRVLRELGELDVSGSYRDQAVSAAAWLRRRQHQGEDTARAAVRLAGRLRTDLPDLLGALEAGDTTVGHVQAVAAGTSGLDAELVAQAQPALLELARAAEPAVVRRQLRERAEAISPDLARDADRRSRARQGFYADSVAGAGVLLGGQLAEEDGAVLLHGLDLCVQADRTAGGAPGGAPGDSPGDARSLPARRAAVLVDWARTAASSAAGGSGGQDVPALRTHLLLTCTPDQLAATAHAHAHAQLTGAPEPAGLQGEAALAVLTGSTPCDPARLATTGASLLPEALRRLACDAAVSLLAAHPHTTGRPPIMSPQAARPVPRQAEILFAGRTLRTVTSSQLKALTVRDRHCIVAGCGRRPTQCAAHHVRHWLDGGPTDLDNLVLLCHRHHHDHHDRGHPLPHHDGRWLTSTGWNSAPP